MSNIFIDYLLPIDYQMKETTGDRLEKIKKQFGLTNITLGEVMETNNSHVGRILKGENNLTAEMLLKLYSNIGVNINWLLTGEGDMLVDKKSGTKPDYIELLIHSKDFKTVQFSLDLLSQALQDAAHSGALTAGPVERLPLGKTSNEKSVKGSQGKSNSHKGSV